MLQLGGFAAATGQRWKFAVLALLTIVVVALTVAFLSLWNGNPADLPLGATALLYLSTGVFWFAWWAAAIRCPSCGVRLGWYGMTHGRPVAGLDGGGAASGCPRCGFDPAEDGRVLGAPMGEEPGSLEQMRESFERATAILDRELEAALRALPSPPYGIWEDSNRGGWDMAGVPLFRWAFHVFRDTERGGRIWRHGVELAYVEPDDQEVAHTHAAILTATSVAEVFQVGATASFKRETRREVPFSELRPGALLGLVREALAGAEAELARLGAQSE